MAKSKAKARSANTEAEPPDMLPINHYKLIQLLDEAQTASKKVGELETLLAELRKMCILLTNRCDDLAWGCPDAWEYLRRVQAERRVDAMS